MYGAESAQGLYDKSKWFLSAIDRLLHAKGGRLGTRMRNIATVKRTSLAKRL